MKNFYLILVGSLLTSGAFSQAPINTSNFDEAPAHHTARNTRALNVSSSRQTIDKMKVNVVDMTAAYYSSTPDYDYYYLFPDSAINALYGTTVASPFIHSFGQVFDMSSPVINSNTAGLPAIFDVTAPITLDSIASFGVYAPSRNASVVDTLIYRVIGTTTNLKSVYFFTGTSTNYPGSNDTTTFVALEVDTVAWEAYDIVAEYKIPLSLSDTTANGLMYARVATPGVTVGRVFAVTVDFKPGGTYTPFTDTMGYGVGSYTQVTAEGNGDGTYSNYIPGDYTGSSSLPSVVRYKVGGTWNGLYIPYLAYGANQFESIDLDVTVSQTNALSVKEIAKEADLFQNFPNPSNGMTTVRYSLQNEANVTFEMIDVTGKKVVSTIEGNKNPGVYSIELNTAELNSGIYFYSILVNGNKITKKMTITK